MIPKKSDPVGAGTTALTELEDMALSYKLHTENIIRKCDQKEG